MQAPAQCSCPWEWWVSPGTSFQAPLPNFGVPEPQAPMSTGLGTKHSHPAVKPSLRALLMTMVVFYFGGKVSQCSPGWSSFCARLLLPRPPESWNLRYVPPHLVLSTRLKMPGIQEHNNSSNKKAQEQPGVMQSCNPSTLGGCNRRISRWSAAGCSAPQ